jgi:hypothetical protein
MQKLTLPSAAIVVGLILAACSSAAGPSAPPATAPGASPDATAPPAAGGVDHPTGASDVVLRLARTGGFIAIETAAGETPLFTLYGDGRVVFQPRTETFPEADADGVTRLPAQRTAQLDAGQVEELLTFALAQGGLGAAREDYGNAMLIDAGNTVFTIDAGGVDKVVTVAGLGDVQPGDPDGAAKTQFNRLVERLTDFDAGGTIPTDAFAPTGYRAVLIEREADPAVPGPAAAAWPWPDLTVADFPAGDGSSAQAFPHRTLTADEVAAMGLGDVSGGAQGLIVRAPDEKTYTVVLRPLLPDETE